MMAKRRKTDADKLRAMVDSERLGATAAIDILNGWEDVREHAEALTAVAEAIDLVQGEIDTYEDLTGYEKADARLAALEAIEALLMAIEEWEALPDLPDLSESGPLMPVAPS